MCVIWVMIMQYRVSIGMVQVLMKVFKVVVLLVCDSVDSQCSLIVKIIMVIVVIRNFGMDIIDIVLMLMV